MIIRVYRDDTGVVRVRGIPNEDSEFYKFALRKVEEGKFNYIEWEDSVLTHYNSSALCM